MGPKMTSSLRRSRRAGGFTLVELLVVVGMIVLLATILIPAVKHAYQQAIRVRMAADLQVISQALEAYRQDFGDYPRLVRPNVGTQDPKTRANSGANLLCWALVAPGPAAEDGCGADPNNQTINGTADLPGPGFRIRGLQGKVYGPYLPVDRFRVGPVDMNPGSPNPGGVLSTTSYHDWEDVLGDRYNTPILYFPASKGPNPANLGGFISKYPVGTLPAQSVFNFNDNRDLARLNPANKLTLTMMEWRMGDVAGSGGQGPPNGTIDAPNETAIATGPFLLWSAGPDGIFGTDDDVVDNGTQLQLNTSPIPPNTPQEP